jgi:hypothetical protein
MQQRQAIKADILGVALLVVVVSCALKINVKAVVVVGTVGLAWLRLALLVLSSLTQS